MNSRDEFPILRIRNNAGAHLMDRLAKYGEEYLKDATA
jgi:hypothetical protein